MLGGSEEKKNNLPYIYKISCNYFNYMDIN